MENPLKLCLFRSLQEFWESEIHLHLYQRFIAGNIGGNKSAVLIVTGYIS